MGWAIPPGQRVLQECCCSAQRWLTNELQLDADGVGRLAGFLGQCQAMANLDLSCKDIRAAGAQSLAGVLGQCTMLAHLDLHVNDDRIDHAEVKRLRESLDYEESDWEDQEDADEREDEDDQLED